MVGCIVITLKEKTGNTGITTNDLIANSSNYMPLQSGIFTINKYKVIGLVSSIITALIGYGIRLVILKYFDYDVFANLDNIFASVSYFGLIGTIAYVIKECIKENTLMYDSGDSVTFSNNTAGNNATGLNCTMQAPSNSGTGSSSAGDASNIMDRSVLEQNIAKKENNVSYFSEQREEAEYALNDVRRDLEIYSDNNKREELRQQENELKNAITD